jgi:hypothetical protein
MLEAKNIEEALSSDKDMQAGIKAYSTIDDKALAVAQEITKAMVENIVKEESEFNISTAILAVSKSLIQLASFMYDTEEEFLIATKKARTSVVSEIIPTLLAPEPCGLCEECKNGHPEECLSPKVRHEYTQSRFLPILCGHVIEYDLFNKVLHMHTAGKNSFDVASTQKEEEN